MASVIQRKMSWYNSMVPLQKNYTLVDTSAMMKVAFRMEDGNTKYGYFEDICIVNTIDAAPMPKDSDSAITAQNDRGILGILFAAGRLRMYFCKLMF